MKICKHCGEVNTNETEFCLNCGKSNFVFDINAVCSHCGASNGSGYNFCIECGQELEHQVVAAKAIKPVTTELIDELTADYSSAVDLSSEGMRRYFDENLEELETKEISRCTNCGTIVPVNAIFCNKCGTPTDTLHDLKIIKRKMCNECGTPNVSSNALCSYCYNSLRDARSEEFQVIHEMVQFGTVTTKQTFIHNTYGKYKICSNCNSINKKDSKTCYQCGTRLVVEENKRFCVNCGTENDSDTKFCTKCQYSFEGVLPQSKTTDWVCKNCGESNDVGNNYCSKCGQIKQ